MSIQRYREAAGLNRAELARMVGVTRQAVIRWEEGQADPLLRHLKKMAGLFSCKIDDLAYREEETA